MAEWKMHDTENGRKFTHWKMAENTHLENNRTEIAQHGKWQNEKCTTRKMAENSYIGKWQKIHTWKMIEWKMHNTENGRKFTYWKVAENTHLENGRTENARHGKWKKSHPLENGRKCTPWNMTEHKLSLVMNNIIHRWH